jgi:uncharacterized protein YggE
MRKRSVFVLGVVLALTLGQPASAYAVPASDSEIDVTGEGAVHATPDVARVTLGVEVFGNQVAAADREADQRVAGLVRMLRSAGVAEGHIRTAELTIEPRYETRTGEPMELQGFVVCNLLEIETADINGLPALLDAAIAGGANRIDGVTFETRSLADLQSQARDRAWQSARVKAEQLALKSGLRLGNVARAEEPLIEAVSTVRADALRGAPGVLAADDSNVQRGEIEVRAQVRVVWTAIP